MPPQPDRDPRSEAEKARADLKANSELGLAPPESPITQQPSVTPQTFGVTNSKAQVLSGNDQGLEAGGARPDGGGRGGSQSIAEAEQVTAGRDSTTSKQDVQRNSKGES
jgi:hypothetical protein